MRVMACSFFVVKEIESIKGIKGFIPLMCLPKVCVGKTVKVTIEEVNPIEGLLK